MNSDDDEDNLGIVVLENEEDNWENLSNPDLEVENNTVDLHEISDGDSGKSDDENSHDTPSTKRIRLDTGPIFEWKNTSFTPTIHNSDEQNSGCKIESLEYDRFVLDIFEAFITKDLVEKSVQETNAYYCFVEVKTPR